MERFRRQRIFVAEDNIDDLEIARRAFKRCQIVGELVVARDGADAARQLDALATQGGLPDLVLLDINLPRRNGFEVLRGLRADQRFCGLPVIMMSASGREEDIVKAYRLGAHSYIQKPAVFEDFIETLEVLTRYWFDVVRLPRQPGSAA